MAKDLLNSSPNLLAHFPLDLVDTHLPVSTSTGPFEFRYEIHLSPETPNMRNTETQQRAT